MRCRALSTEEQRDLLDALAYMVRHGALLGDAWRWNLADGCPWGGSGEEVARHLIVSVFREAAAELCPRLPESIRQARRNAALARELDE